MFAMCHTDFSGTGDAVSKCFAAVECFNSIPITLGETGLCRAAQSLSESANGRLRGQELYHTNAALFLEANITLC